MPATWAKKSGCAVPKLIEVRSEPDAIAEEAVNMIEKKLMPCQGGREGEGGWGGEEKDDTGERERERREREMSVHTVGAANEKACEARKRKRLPQVLLTLHHAVR